MQMWGRVIISYCIMSYCDRSQARLHKLQADLEILANHLALMIHDAISTSC